MAGTAAGCEARDMTLAIRNSLFSPCTPRNVSWFILEVGLENPLMFMLACIPKAALRSRSGVSAASRCVTNLRHIWVLKSGNRKQKIKGILAAENRRVASDPIDSFSSDLSEFSPVSGDIRAKKSGDPLESDTFREGAQMVPLDQQAPR